MLIRVYEYDFLFYQHSQCVGESIEIRGFNTCTLMGGSRGVGETGGPGPHWNCQIICHVEIFRQTPSGTLDTPLPAPLPHEKIFWIRA